MKAEMTISSNEDAAYIARLAAFLKSWLTMRYEQCDLPGLAVAIAVDNRVVFDEAFGYANLEHKEKLTTDHLFRVASHSKTFTGAALMQLAAQAKLVIDQPVVKYLPWLAKHKDKRMLEITTRQLLSHSAGVIRDGLDADCWQFKKPFPDNTALQADVLAADLIFDSNLKMKYSNLGYGILGLIVEAASGMRYNEYVIKNIIEPLGLKNTGPEVAPAMTSRLVSGYSRIDAYDKGPRRRLPLDSTIDTGALAAATGFYSKASDLCTYFAAHIVGSGKLLDDASKKEMQRTQWPVTNSTFNQEYGLGLQIDLVGSRRVIGHAGGFPGMATRTLCDPSAKIVVSVLTNAVDSDPTAICRAIYSFIDHYQSLRLDHGEKDGDKPSHFEGRFLGVFADLQILEGAEKSDNKPKGKHFIAFRPGSWMPLADVEEMILVDDKTLMVTKGNGFSCEGELVHFHFDKGAKVSGKQASAITYGGMTLSAPSKI